MEVGAEEDRPGSHDSFAFSVQFLAYLHHQQIVQLREIVSALNFVDVAPLDECAVGRGVRPMRGGFVGRSV